MHPIYSESSQVNYSSTNPAIATDAQTMPLSQWAYHASWWNKAIAIVILCNLLLVLFNSSYIPLRDIYIRYLPRIVQFYDPVKHIEPHPDTQRYLNTVDQLKAQLETTGLQAPEVNILLADLQQQSINLLDENPFVVSSKFGIFAKIKRQMQQYLDQSSAKKAFEMFWSKAYLTEVGWSKVLADFDYQIRPLMDVNYYRMVDANGQFVDEFWRIDAWFILFFGLEFLGHTFYISRTQRDVNWLDAMLRRWYDALLLLPIYRWLRLISAGVRLHQSRLLNTERILGEITHESAAYLADRVSTFLLVRFINQTKDAVKQGEMIRALFDAGPYIRVSNTNKVDALFNRLLELTIYNVLPKIQPDLEALLRHSLREALKDSQVYHNLLQIPGLDRLPGNVTEQFADYLAQTSYNILEASYSDVEGRQLLDRLNQEFRDALRRAVQEHKTQEELQHLLSDLLEELKLNYVQQATQYNPEETLSEADQLYQAAEAGVPHLVKPMLNSNSIDPQISTFTKRT